jgi:hypothetical protein
MNLIPTFCPDRQCPEMQNAKELFKNVSSGSSSALGGQELYEK